MGSWRWSYERRVAVMMVVHGIIGRLTRTVVEDGITSMPTTTIVDGFLGRLTRTIIVDGVIGRATITKNQARVPTTLGVSSPGPPVPELYQELQKRRWPLHASCLCMMLCLPGAFVHA